MPNRIGRTKRIGGLIVYDELPHPEVRRPDVEDIDSQACDFCDCFGCRACEMEDGTEDGPFCLCEEMRGR